MKFSQENKIKWNLSKQTIQKLCTYTVHERVYLASQMLAGRMWICPKQCMYCHPQACLATDLKFALLQMAMHPMHLLNHKKWKHTIILEKQGCTKIKQQSVPLKPGFHGCVDKWVSNTYSLSGVIISVFS